MVWSGYIERLYMWHSIVYFSHPFQLSIIGILLSPTVRLKIWRDNSHPSYNNVQTYCKLCNIELHSQIHLEKHYEWICWEFYFLFLNCLETTVNHSTAAVAWQNSKLRCSQAGANVTRSTCQEFGFSISLHDKC